MLMIGDCIERMRELDDQSVDAVVTDPPYGLSAQPDMAEVLRHWLAGDDYEHRGGGFMGRDWDSFVPGPAVWREVHRVLKPGGHLVAFFGTRTYDIGTLAIRLAGFEIRDQVAWMFGQGFPKSRNLDGGWEGWGTALKPGYEPIVLARRSLSGTVAATVLEHGTGALNIDGCRIEAIDGGSRVDATRRVDADRTTYDLGHRRASGDAVVYETPDAGRWPANVLLDEAAATLLDRQAGPLKSGNLGGIRGESAADRGGNISAALGAESRPAGSRVVGYGDRGGASRFFYVSKASTTERNAGLDALPLQEREGSAWSAECNVCGNRMCENSRPNCKHDDFRWVTSRPTRNVHPTVKPIDVMRWLCRLVTPPGGLVLDPFLGSGTTGCAAALEGFEFVGIERDEAYAAIAAQRIAYWAALPSGTDTRAAVKASRRSKPAAAQLGLDGLEEARA